MFERTLRAVDKMLYGQQIELNELLKVRFENPTSVSLHITSTTDREKQRSIGETRSAWREALTNLAQMMREDRKFRGVKTITLTAWLPRIIGPMFEQLGFHVDYNDEDPEGRFYRARNAVRNVFGEIPEKYRGTKPCFIKMSRDELFERYGSDGTAPTTSAPTDASL